jgi:hypothetical protein
MQRFWPLLLTCGRSNSPRRSRVGRPLPGALRTEPDVRLSRIRLPPRVSKGKPLLGPRVKDKRLGQPFVGQAPNPRPAEPVFLAAASERLLPAADDLGAEGFQRAAVQRHGMVVELAVTTCRSHRSCAGSGRCIRPRNSTLIALSFARMRLSPIRGSTKRISQFTFSP